MTFFTVVGEETQRVQLYITAHPPTPEDPKTFTRALFKKPSLWLGCWLRLGLPFRTLSLFPCPIDKNCRSTHGKPVHKKKKTYLSLLPALCLPAMRVMKNIVSHWVMHSYSPLIIWCGKDWRKPSFPSRPCRAVYQFDPMSQWAKAFSSSKGTKEKPSLFPTGHLWREICPQELLVTIMGLWLGRRMSETRCSPRSWEMMEQLNHLPGPGPRHLVKLLVPGLFNKMMQYIFWASLVWIFCSWPRDQFKPGQRGVSQLMLLQTTAVTTMFIFEKWMSSP